MQVLTRLLTTATRKIGDSMGNLIDRVIEFVMLVIIFAGVVFISYGAGGWPKLIVQ